MPTLIRIDLGPVVLHGELDDGEAGRSLAGALPFEWRVSRWGEEYYGGLDTEVDDAQGPKQTQMAVGDLAWAEEQGWLCLFFGPTPVSDGEEPVAAFGVQKAGAVQGDWAAVSGLGGEVSARVEAV